MKTPLLLASLTLALLPAASARADTVPSLIGTWALADEAFAAARVGTSNKYFDDLPKPTFGTPDQAFTYTIEAQDGRAFHGVATGPQGKSEAIVGVIRFDNKEILMSGDSGTVEGRLVDDKLELCWIDSLPTWNAVSCGLFKKTK
ncbi:hypothetical protein [Ancylobacter vacuolatus]|uniref:Lipocalin-like domain-containing protein n=1 Tax=Ancylobacter vacuolatus TaxID=223389 RepID=A0ABU0DLP7_9HYPH|nr:hypothetical protein [Ancylobacter vacuolatus]MDQ0349357.1 hypothetical protein [Ancylobacter vacuolatus]